MKVLALTLGLIASVTALKHQKVEYPAQHKALRHEWASSS